MTPTNTPGTIGYVAPEYGLMGKLSARGDVYSYGILLLETLTRKKPTDAMFTGGLSLRRWVDESCPEGVRGVVDEFLVMGGGENGDYHDGNGKDAENQCLLSLLELGLLCSKESPKERMTMRQVVVRLTKIRMDFSLHSPRV
ncbi:putative LRR receptor-like serine/threonine-protein kinase [Acorus calamus]|uniref:LRR receptor-like serine/threonine-protein kinase n=1 Tax=Acorus calamus TaxID=4465 RepID=A0AAV9C9X0_ACOCL|nr:putative LRR receptor-like serine/threonine-protein kinase [Acorus calamus]KAK1285102.1 putative LRR receptor-like serine/threonine-protein kinase [Acorus calamus]